ncbi:MAG: hypothetical protein AMJ61_03960 [Desulfobacterales bacterium SG8_35_2]|jgi:hypothetical protein|nr:MAG: hypothetical protein AMJ61_03960 [Desulfobacterales bacterium SG8_35_2]
MKVGKMLLVFFTLVLLCTIPLAKVQAASFSGRSSTVIEWFDDPSDETALPIYEYILLNVRDLGNGGMNFKGYGRLASDTQDVVDVDSRLYYAFLEKQGVFDSRVDFRFGRQFVVTTAGASVMDGLDITFNNVGPLNFRFFGGGDATYYESYDKDDLLWGAEVYGLFLQNRLNLGLSYMQKWDESELAKELIGIDLDYDRENLINIYSEFQFNYLNNAVSYFLAGAKYYKSSKWNLRTEYLYSLPVFTSTSIYSVFAVDKYQEFMAEYAYNIAVGLRAFGRYSHEFYEEFSDADVFEAGIEKIRRRNFSGYLTVVYRNDDDGQNLRGVKARAAWMFSKKLQAGVGANVDVLDRRIDFENNEDETTSDLFWLYGTYFFTNRVNVQLKVERASSDLWDEYYRGRVRFNISF